MSNHSLPNPICSCTTSSTKAFVPLYSTSSFSPLSSSAALSCTNYSSTKLIKLTHFSTKHKLKGFRVLCSQSVPLKVMISGAPASGKGTQCELIVQKFGLVHVSTGDLLRAEVSAGTDIGNKAKEYMNSGHLVPDEIVTQMVQTRLSLPDAKERGWLLDGYPRSLSQAESLEKMNIRPDICIMLDVPDTTLIERCVGRRLDPVTGKIYHIKYFPPENEEIKSRLVTRPDDTEEKVKSRLQIYKENTNAIVSTYGSILKKLNGNRPKEEVFSEIRGLLTDVQKQREDETKSGELAMNGSSPVEVSSTKVSNSRLEQKNWRGIPTRLNNIPHSREIREYFYNDVLQATKKAIIDGKTRLKNSFVKEDSLYQYMRVFGRAYRHPISKDNEKSSKEHNQQHHITSQNKDSYKAEINIPELNPEMDVYRIGTLMELVRVLALSFADDGKRVKVCVQGSMGQGALAGIPLQLAGSRKILEYMDWGDYGAKGTFVNIGAVGIALTR
ncbi:nucleotide kinase [Lithospermum erythrorhizon]|uniref:adenylate kinase n=1 Tax=Lithospermum erythrorhizon TaxID=34254 RepID=A0AAV3Q715_LITER